MVSAAVAAVVLLMVLLLLISLFEASWLVPQDHS